jgi:hypothetical protein
MDEYYMAHFGEDKYMVDPNAQVSIIRITKEKMVIL